MDPAPGSEKPLRLPCFSTWRQDNSRKVLPPRQSLHCLGRSPKASPFNSSRYPAPFTYPQPVAPSLLGQLFLHYKENPRDLRVKDEKTETQVGEENQSSSHSQQIFVRFSSSFPPY